MSDDPSVDDSATAQGSGWNADDYDDKHEYVTAYGESLVDRLDARPGERVLVVGCGTGHLSAKISDGGAVVHGIDASEDMIEQARESYPDLTFEQADAREFDPVGQYDAIFSNAALHWIPESDHPALLKSLADTLTEGGRFVAEMGGKGNVETIVSATAGEVRERGYEPTIPWYFPTIDEYSTLLGEAGFETQWAVIFDRPTEVGGQDGLRNWLDMFGDSLLADVPEAERPALLAAIEDRLRDELYDAEAEVWFADYRRLRFEGMRDENVD
jgi:trans-aconitate methyltransferase